MPDRRRHRGAHPAESGLFSGPAIETLRRATLDLSWLLSHGYPPVSSLKLVGDRYHLRERQRAAIGRAACSDESRERRLAGCVPIQQIGRDSVSIDGFNLIITTEAALGGALLLLCRDGCVRDISSVHGSYRSVVETEEAITIAGGALSGLGVMKADWYLDSPVSNSGRLAEKVRPYCRGPRLGLVNECRLQS